MQLQQQEQINIKITDSDIITCNCGCQEFIQVIKIAKTRNPIIGQPDIIIPLGSTLKCFVCGRYINDESTSNK